MIRRGRMRLAGTVAGLLVLAGCGDASNSTDNLGAGLDRVDAAVVARDYDAARDALDDLESEATSLADSGDLSTADERALVNAVDDLRTALPDGAQTPPQDPSTETSSPPPPTPTTTPPSDEGDPADTPKPDKPGKGNDTGSGKGKGKKAD